MTVEGHDDLIALDVCMKLSRVACAARPAGGTAAPHVALELVKGAAQLIPF